MKSFFLLAILTFSQLLAATEMAAKWSMGSWASYIVYGDKLQGTMVEYVREYQEDNVWIVQSFKYDDGINYKLEILLDPKNEKMLKLIQNGTEKLALDHNTLSIVSEATEPIEVLAGKFDSTRRKMRNTENGWIRETWTSTQVPMNGLLKMVGDTELGTLKFELVSYEWGKP